jgi:hypothetical protein
MVSAAILTKIYAGRVAALVLKQQIRPVLTGGNRVCELALCGGGRVVAGSVPTQEATDTSAS